VADALGLRAGAVALKTGAASRDKLFTVELPTGPAGDAALDRFSLLRAGPRR
jgi:hypothetical protein